MKGKEISVRKTDKGITYSKQWDGEDGLRNEMSVEEVEGGYIVTSRKWGDKKLEDGNTEWIDEETKKVTTENPLKAEDEGEQKMFDFIDKPSMGSEYLS